VFDAGLGVALAVPSEQVLEVVTEQQAGSLPSRPELALGLSRHRGRLVPLIDLSARLGRESQGSRQTLFIRLASRSGQTLGLSVVAVRGRTNLENLMTVDRDYGIPPAWIQGVGQIENQVVLVIDPNSVVLI
jgi:chemotaxis signal transduction protein